MPLRLKFLSCPFDIVDVKLKPSLWRRKLVGPRVLIKAGLRCLRKRPQSETPCAFQSLGMKITAILFFEANTEDSVVELATCTSLTDDRPGAGYGCLSVRFIGGLDHVRREPQFPCRGTRVLRGRIFLLVGDKIWIEFGCMNRAGGLFFPPVSFSFTLCKSLPANRRVCLDGPTPLAFQ
jgi:hypothetical protein